MISSSARLHVVISRAHQVLKGKESAGNSAAAKGSLRVTGKLMRLIHVRLPHDVQGADASNTAPDVRTSRSPAWGSDLSTQCSQEDMATSVKYAQRVQNVAKEEERFFLFGPVIGSSSMVLIGTSAAALTGRGGARLT